MKTRIMLVDDHPVFRSGLKHILCTETDYHVIAEADDGESAIEMAAEMMPDIIVMDISMPGLDGIEVTREIKKKLPGIRVLMLTMYSDEAFLKESLDAGASGYVLKRAVDTELVHAVKLVMNGEHYIYPTLIPKLYNANQAPQASDSSNDEQIQFSQREKEVLKYIALGYTQKEISTELFISIKTVDTYKKRVMDKIGSKKKSALVRYALKNNIISNSL
ncbi:response regulator transcription factor [Salisediminibacterium beveridgei]|uniref:Two component transcriptional regulator, LuxR family n=1 Tax=Salisediminibacterium beveridgei TaxID=632773 RepID=A0A1D7QWV9_9BACI|nr:response regulator transcription factor [Salisediminibacterium beveridgei]AOM83496.1 two component transcriptional regulator, LuxR family [Salisediminibacterium beveridgei]